MAGEFPAQRVSNAENAYIWWRHQAERRSPVSCVCSVQSDSWTHANPPLTRPSKSWASYQICKIAGCACAGNAGNVFPHRRCQRKPLVSDPGMHHGTCVTHVSWCMSGSLTCGDGENDPSIPDACATAILRIWQEAHWILYKKARLYSRNFRGS